MMSMEDLKKLRDKPYYGCDDIAQKLVELSNLYYGEELCKELSDALYQIKAIAENPYNCDSYRVLYNVLLVITGFECF